MRFFYALLCTSLILFFSQLALGQNATPTCSSQKVEFFGELKYLKRAPEGSANKYEKVREVLPLGDSYNVHSNDWKRVFVRIPPELRQQKDKLSIDVFSQAENRPQKSVVQKTLVLGDIDEGVYSLEENIQFSNLLPRGGFFAPGFISFILKFKKEDFCKFKLLLTEVGD